ncbi:MAG: DPP IV N-terminal domain-containing protein, partial [Chitinophagaceae bacterium]
MKSFKLYIVLHWVLHLLLSMSLQGQEGLSWTPDGKGYYSLENGNLIRVTLPSQTKTVLVKASELIPPGNSKALDFRQFSITQDEQKVLLLTNTRKVWRLETRGDYWVLDRRTAKLQQLGKQRPASSLMFTKFSPDGQSVAYVSDYNIYVEELTSGISRALTKDGNRKFINGTFDWVYEEEFFCRDGFRWSPDSKQIAFWQIDARNTKDYLMINNTDSIYPFVTPVEYPIAGEPPSPFRIGAITVATGDIQWMSISTDPVLQSYVPRMEWAANSKELIVQHLNRHQNFSELLICNSQTGASRSIYQEKDSAWIDILPLWDEDYAYGGWDWLNGGNEFLWASEKDGWRHVYRVSRDGQTERLLTPGSYDVMDIAAIDEPNGYLYFHASPDNATQKYLYRTRLDGKGKLERITPLDQSGTHDYDVSPGALFAQHHFSSHQVRPVTELIALKDHQF